MNDRAELMGLEGEVINAELAAKDWQAIQRDRRQMFAIASTFAAWIRQQMLRGDALPRDVLEALYEYDRMATFWQQTTRSEGDADRA